MVEHLGQIGAGLGEEARRLLAAFEVPFDPLALDALRDAVGDRSEVGEHLFRDGVLPEDGQHADRAPLDQQGVTRKGDHSLAGRPGRVADVRIVGHVVGQQRLAVAGDAPDLEVADLDPAMGPVEMRVHPGARLQEQHVFRFVEGPHPGERSVQVFDQPLDATPENCRQRLGAAEMDADLAAHGGEPLGFGGLPAQFQHVHDLPRQGTQGPELRRLDLARLLVEHAERAQGKTGRRTEHRPGVETHLGAIRADGIVAEARVEQGVRDDEKFRFENRVAAERGVERQLAHVADADLAFHPLPPGVDEAHQRNRRVAKLGGDLAKLVEVALRRGVENAVAPERSQARLFIIAGEGGGIHGLPPMVPTSRPDASLSSRARRDSTRVRTVPGRMPGARDGQRPVGIEPKSASA